VGQGLVAADTIIDRSRPGRFHWPVVGKAQEATRLMRAVECMRQTADMLGVGGRDSMVTESVSYAISSNSRGAPVAASSDAGSRRESRQDARQLTRPRPACRKRPTDAKRWL